MFLEGSMLIERVHCSCSAGSLLMPHRCHTQLVHCSCPTSVTLSWFIVHAPQVSHSAVSSASLGVKALGVGI